MPTFPAHWNDDVTDHQVHRYDDRTIIIRQALRTNFEGPFSYLLLGSERALLLDTGTGHADLRSVVDGLIGELELVVAHTHSHGDHVGGDQQFETVVGKSAEEVAAYFGIARWPEQIVHCDLGDRIVDIIPIPGHHPSHVAFYDRATRLLLTGNSLYPGRLYVADWPAYRESVARLAAFVAAGNPVDRVLGAHIEMTDRAGVDFAMGADQHPGEHQLQLDPAVLTELAEVMAAAGESPERIVRDHFIVHPV